MGKPIGNGHPLAVVVTTAEIVEEFSRKFNYFNTFGGNPVSAAVGLAVLEVVESEGILQSVHEVGAYLGCALKELASGCEAIGDVRGKGLFYGLDIVRDPESREPWAAEAHRIREFLRREGVLLGTSGPFGNVIKIRPPLVFSREHADLLIGRLQQALSA